MSEVVRQSTARNFIVGPILDADGVAVTDAVIGDLKISKNGAAPAALNGSATLTHRHTGHYSLGGTASDVDTVGTAQITIDSTTNAMPPKELTVIEEAVYDALYVASAVGYGTAQTGDSYAIVSNGTHGNANLKTVLDTKASQTSVDDLPTNSELATALASAIANITQAQRVRVSVPAWLERPDSSSVAYRVWIYVYDEQHKAEDLDSNPTVTAANAAGTDRSANLGTVTKPGGTTGQYYVDYTVASNHALEQLDFKVSATEGAVTTIYPATSLVTDYTATALTPSDLATLLQGASDAGDAKTAAESADTAIGNLNDLSSADVQTAATASLNAYDPPTRTEATADKDAILSKLLKYVQLLARKDSAIATDNATELTAINASGGSGAGAYANTTDSHESIRDRGDSNWSGGGGGSTLTGPYVLTVTVTDSSDDSAIENAKVRVWLNSDSESKLTTDQGEAIYAIDDAIAWNIAIDRYGYESYVGTFAIDGDDLDLPIELDPISINPPASATKITGVKTLSASGQTMTVQLTQGPVGSGLGYGDEDDQTDTAGVDLLVQFQLTRGAYYHYRIGSAGWSREFLVPTTGDSFEIS